MKKLMNKKAFTLMEMLIVVAIIAVLVAIAIPTFSGALTKSKEAADVANIRAAYAQVQVDVLTNGLDENTTLQQAFVKALPDGKTDSLNYVIDTKNTDHGYSYESSTNVITYKAKKIGGDNGKDYTWTLSELEEEE